MKKKLRNETKLSETKLSEDCILRLVYSVFAFAQHRGELGFTQRDIMSEVLTGFGKLEARNVVRALSEKLKWIEKCGTKEQGSPIPHFVEIN